MPAKKITYTYRGEIEVGTTVIRRGKYCPSYRWTPGYSATTDDGGVLFPWMTRAQCCANARSQSGRPTFVRETRVAVQITK